MPLQRCRKNGVSGWKWGNSGACYVGSGAKKKAIKQGIAIEPNRFIANRTRVVASNPLKADPTRTATLRRVFSTDVSRRFGWLKSKILRLIVDEDAFGVRQDNQVPILSNEERDDERRFTGYTVALATHLRVGLSSYRHTGMGVAVPRGKLVLHTRWRFNTDPEKVAEFQRWLQRQVQVDVLAGATQEAQDAYWTRYVEEGYRKGAGRAFDDTRKAALWTGEEAKFFEGTREEFLRESFGRPVAIEKVKLLSSRVFTDLKGVTEAMSTTLSRNLMDGLVQGQNPRQIARTINKSIESIGRKRALLIARTEIIRAHAEGQLDAMERLGVDKVGVMVEWSTAGDDRVCPLCEALSGVVMTVREARGIIPRHPSCRCAHIPANIGESTKGQVRGKQDVQKSIDDSIRAEMPKRTKRTLAEQKNRSKWAGADKTIAKVRPKGPVAPLVVKPRVTPRKVVPVKITPKPTRPAITKPAKPPLKPKPVKPPVADKTEVLKKQLAEQRAKRIKVQQRLKETEAGTKTAKADLKKAETKIKARDKEVADLKAEITAKKREVAAIDRRLKAQDIAHDKELTD